MTVYEIPLQATPQTFPIVLASITYNLTLHWNVPSASWLLDIADANGNALVSSLPFVTGADLLAQFEYLNFGGQMIVQTDHNTDAVPTFANLGDTSHLYFIVP